MNIEKIRIVSLAGAIISLIILFILSKNINEGHVNISDITSEFLNRRVKISGIITSTKGGVDHLFIDVYDGTGKIKVVLWDDTLKYLETKGIERSDIEAGRNISVTGFVKIYRGSLEIIPIPNYIELY